MGRLLDYLDGMRRSRLREPEVVHGGLQSPCKAQSDVQQEVTATEAPDQDWRMHDYGTNRLITPDDDWHSGLEIHVRLKKRFVMEPKVAHRFNICARAAMPNEIGGLLRIVETEDEIRVIDLKIFSHVASSPGYFEIDGIELAKWTTELVTSGRRNEIGEWCSLIHSHPNMRPFLSGTDENQVFQLAGDNRAYSVICSASRNINDNYYAVHYAQVSPTRFLIENIEVETVGGQLLSGRALLSDSEVEDAGNEAVKALQGVQSVRSVGYYNQYPGWRRPVRIFQDD